MARVYLTSTSTRDNPRPVPSRDSEALLVEAARADRYGVHEPVDDPEESDVILCCHLETSPLFEVLCHPLRSRWIERFFYYTNEDRPFPFVPGIYSSLHWSDFNPRRTAGGPYLMVTRRDQIVATENEASSPSYLFSFVGSLRTHPLREKLVDLKHPASLIRDTSGHPAYGPGQPAEVYRQFEADYGASLRNSLFVLCPRGAGPSTIRIYEALKAGRVPVIISDRWVPPPGPLWSSLSLRVAESDIASIPSLLETHAERAPAMGRLALDAWHTFFALDAVFHHLVEACLRLKRTRVLPERFSSRLVYLRALRPRHWRAVLLRRLRSCFGPLYPSI